MSTWFTQSDAKALARIARTEGVGENVLLCIFKTCTGWRSAGLHPNICEGLHRRGVTSRRAVAVSGSLLLGRRRVAVSVWRAVWVGCCLLSRRTERATCHHR